MASPEEEAFRKQRARLLGVSLVAIFLNSASVQLTTLNILGNQLTISNPNALPIAVALALGYFLVRYWQYMHDIENKGFGLRFKRRMEKGLVRPLVWRVMHDPNSYMNQNYGNFKISNLMGSKVELLPNNFAKIEFVHRKHGVLNHSQTIKLTASEKLIPAVLSVFYVVFRTRLVTDYMLPVLLAAVAFLTYLPKIVPYFETLGA